MSPAHEPPVAHIAVVEDNAADVYLLRKVFQSCGSAILYGCRNRTHVR
jgi:hypothetical protein